MMPPPDIPSSGRFRFLHRHWTWWFMVVVVVTVTSARLHLLNQPLERDEGEYAYAGQLILQGIPPYQLAYNMKFPGMYAAYAVIMALFGETPAGIHFGVLCVTTLTTLMLYWLGKQILDRTTGVVAATTYVVLAATPNAFGLAGHAAHFIALFATAGFCALWKARQSLHWLTAAMAGLSFGLAVLMMQPAALIGLWALGAFAIRCFRRSELSFRRRLGPVLALGAGMALPLGLCGLILWHAGVFAKFWFWTFDYARQYTSIVPLSYVPVFFFLSCSQVIGQSFLLWLVVGTGAIWIWFDKRLRADRSWLLGFNVATWLAICPGFYFRPHYFLSVMPAGGLLAGCAVSGLSRCWKERRNRSRIGDWPAWGYAVMVVAAISMNLDIWFTLTPVQATRIIYGLQPFPEAAAVATFIRTNSTSNARVAVLGSEPEIYFLSHRHSATGYIYTFPLMEPQPFARRMQREMIREIESNEPEFIVFAGKNYSWMKRPDSDPAIFEWWNHYRTNYALVGLADVISPTETHYAWGETAARDSQSPSASLMVYRRKSSH